MLGENEIQEMRHALICSEAPPFSAIFCNRTQYVVEILSMGIHLKHQDGLQRFSARMDKNGS